MGEERREEEGTGGGGEEGKRGERVGRGDGTGVWGGRGMTSCCARS